MDKSEQTGYRLQVTSYRSRRRAGIISGSSLQGANKELSGAEQLNSDNRKREPGLFALPFAFCLLPFAFTPLFALFGRLDDLGNALKEYGAVGLFGISFLDSAFVPLPSGPDLGMIVVSAANHAMMPLYALAATLGSTIGCTILYLIARRAGIAALSRVRPERRDKIENLLGRYDMLAVMIPAILPPPFPFKPFVLAAGAFKLKISRFVVAIFIGRAIRFLIEGWLAIQFGNEAFALIKQNGLKVLIVILALLLVFFAVQFYRRKRGKQYIDIEESLPPF